MKIGLSIPSTIDSVDRDTLITWMQRIDRGPFSRLATGERIASPFIDLMSILAAAAVVTERVQIQSLISLAPLHEPTLLAKQAASIDVLSGGRFTLGVGVGIRRYDYELMGKPDLFATRLAVLDERVATMRSIWEGRFEHPEAPPIGPSPKQPGGPPIYSSSLGPKSMARAARWADGLAGFDMGPNLETIEQVYKGFDAAWREAGRQGTPPKQMSFWMGLTNDAPERLPAFAYDYLQIYGEAFARKQSARCNASTAASIRDILEKLEQLGCDEAILTPTTSSLDELSAIEDFAAGL